LSSELCGGVAEISAAFGFFARPQRARRGRGLPRPRPLLSPPAGAPGRRGRPGRGL